MQPATFDVPLPHPSSESALGPAPPCKHCQTLPDAAKHSTSAPPATASSNLGPEPQPLHALQALHFVVDVPSARACQLCRPWSAAVIGPRRRRRLTVAACHSPVPHWPPSRRTCRERRYSPTRVTGPATAPSSPGPPALRHTAPLRGSPARLPQRQHRSQTANSDPARPELHRCVDSI
ncbi:hypothetical protein BS50DRAFT_32325 [Corynespora cassiicola Philippines]|uniref:Uncharacterized protein n=1 Tax=Corynespora cassiicola Philippines TaxID=1448308 RepID=A0A2T2PBN5_CORCC|nr:hypothetical protein BS50DRAFT_32325 [Corynespora cassiicola Philippines]